MSNIHHPDTDTLAALVAPYRKTGVTKRNEENIRQSVEELLTQMTLEEKIGQMSQCADSEFSFGADIEAGPTEVLVRE